MQGVPKVTEIDRAANSPVVAATETIRYDANGYRNSLTDWNGNNTSGRTTATACRPDHICLCDDELADDEYYL